MTQYSVILDLDYDLFVGTYAQDYVPKTHKSYCIQGDDPATLQATWGNGSSGIGVTAWISSTGLNLNNPFDLASRGRVITGSSGGYDAIFDLTRTGSLSPFLIRNDIYSFLGGL